MRSIKWDESAFASDELEVLGTFSRSSDSFTLGEEVALWQQWVLELCRGELWVVEDLESAYDARDELEKTLALVPPSLKARIYEVVDELDRTFREHTVNSGYARTPNPSQWWRGRIPLKTSQRLFLFDKRD